MAVARSIATFVIFSIMEKVREVLTLLSKEEKERAGTIATEIIEQIQQGSYEEHETLPKDFELARLYQVSRAVIQQAIRRVEKEGYVTQRYGVGVFVNAKPLFEAGIEQLESVTSMIRQSGSRPGTIYLDIQDVERTEELDQLFQSDQKQYVAMKRVRTADDVPVVYCIDYAVREQLQFDGLGLWNDSIFDTIERNTGYPIVKAVTQIEPVGYDEEASMHLRCGVDVPLLALYQTHYNDHGEVVLYSKNYFRADKFKFKVVRTRENE